MEFFSTDQMGVTLVEPTDQQRLMLLESVTIEGDADFPEVYLTSSSGIVLGYRSDGCLLWEEQGEVAQYLPDTDVKTAMQAWNLLIAKDRAGLDALAWIPISGDIK